MRIIKYSVIACLILLTGCQEFVDNQDARMVGAESISGKYKIQGTTYTLADIVASPKDGNVDNVAKIWIGQAALESVKNCNAFRARLGATEMFIDTSFDLLSIASSGAAAVTLVPSATRAALSAGSTFFSGSRTALDNDLFAKSTAPLILSEIDKDYYTTTDGGVLKFVSDLSATPATQINVSGQYANLLSIHNKCSLTYAVARLQTQTK